MDRHVLVVFTSPAEGREAEYNDWYTNEHLPDVLAIDGFVAAQRFELAPMDPPRDGRHPYLAVYEVEGDLAAADSALNAALTTMHITGALERGRTHAAYYTPLTPRVVAPPSPAAET